MKFCGACTGAGDGESVIESEEVDLTEERVEALELSGELGHEL